jgi:transposase
MSEMAGYRDLIRESFEKQPAVSIAEACERIYQLTGLRRGPSQVRKFLKDLGLKFYRVRAIPLVAYQCRTAGNVSHSEIDQT